MARPIWRGHISFGLVNIPVTLHSAKQSHELQFKLFDRRNKAGINYKRVNEQTGKEVPWAEIIKGYEYEDDNYVFLTDADFKNAAVEATQTVDIVDFIDRDEIDQMYYDRPYYLMPDKKGAKGYVLLRETLEKTNKVAMGKVVIRTREHLAAIFPRDDALVLNLMRFEHELVDPGELNLPTGAAKSHKISSRELEIAEQLVNAMTSKWKPEKYKDDYHEALTAYIEKKAKSGGKKVAPQGKAKKRPEATISNFADLLKKSVAQKGRSSRSTKTGRRKSGKHKSA